MGLPAKKMVHILRVASILQQWSLAQGNCFFNNTQYDTLYLNNSAFALCDNKWDGFYQLSIE